MASEAVLLERAQAGDREALGELLATHEAACYSLALHLTGNAADAQDICQDALARAVTRLPGGAVRDCRPWLLSIVVSVHRNRADSDSARRRRERSYAMGRDTVETTQLPDVERKELRRRLADSLARLEEQYRLPIVLHHEQGLSYAQVAAVLAVPEGTVATNIKRGLEELKGLLTAAGYGAAVIGAGTLEAALAQAPAVAVPAGLSAFVKSLAAGRAAEAAGTGTTATTGGALAAGSKIAAGVLLAAALGFGGLETWKRLHEADLPPLTDLAELAPGWTGEVIARVDQSCAGRHVEIGDADNDGKNEILTTGSPDSRLDLFSRQSGRWTSRTLAKRLSAWKNGMGQVVRVADLNGDGRNEVIVGTGVGYALLHVLTTDGETLTSRLSCRLEGNDTVYTNGLAVGDLNGDGVKEIVAAYGGGGEVHRFDVDRDLTAIRDRKVFQCSGSGQDAVIADVDGDGRAELVISDGYRHKGAKFHICDYDGNGELVLPPRITVEGYEARQCFHCGVAAGDFDNDGRPELIVMWKRGQSVSMGTIIAYRIEGGTVTPLCTITEDDRDLDTGYGTRGMRVADADNDGSNELVVSTVGERTPDADGSPLGHVLMFKATGEGQVQKTLLAKFRAGVADSSWSAVGDADNDGMNEIILATGTGDRLKPGGSYVVLLKKE